MSAIVPKGISYAVASGKQSCGFRHRRADGQVPVTKSPGQSSFRYAIGCKKETEGKGRRAAYGLVWTPPTWELAVLKKMAFCGSYQHIHSTFFRAWLFNGSPA